jgi:hypothetical protein
MINDFKKIYNYNSGLTTVYATGIIAGVVGMMSQHDTISPSDFLSIQEILDIRMPLLKSAFSIAGSFVCANRIDQLSKQMEQDETTISEPIDHLIL